jgi:hypothetical protein
VCNATVLASASPSQVDALGWASKENKTQLVMPLWSKDELLACRKLSYPEVGSRLLQGS